MESYFDKQGNPISQSEWQLLFVNSAYRNVEISCIRESIIYTSWFGVNFNADPSIEPVFFETIILGQLSEAFEPLHYSSERAAVIGHFSIFNAVRAQLSLTERHK